ncbi:hypothetical protein FIU83_08850 [Halomonas sp. THAF5a]|uniref:hypothetical protein n=1 Tax=Halomonas sp. THAF5a TaxID=2587844 RepID=UPI0012686D84|nr:hypothetical protein [Halomonas sp. THAF5a]QFU01746.1 hypothetical protein FIU83_08850 [Halomonas sp. THAF5a]
MQLLVVSYTPGSYLLHCLEADQMPRVGETLEAERIRGRVVGVERLSDVQGVEGTVILDDLLDLADPAMSMAAPLRP